MDLISLNIQRGRDHGLPGFNHFRKLCGLKPAASFEELKLYLRPGSAELFEKLYQHVNDIDLFPGLNHELPVPGGVMGSTMACIISDQQRRGKFGDRFWYENGGFKHSFTPGLIEITYTYANNLLQLNWKKLGKLV